MAIDLAPLKRTLTDHTRRRLDNAVIAMTAELRRTAPVDTGDLSRNVGVRVTTATPPRMTAEASIDVDYGVFVVQGTQPHIITPRSARALRFYWPKAGAVVYFTKVNHPGTRANDFFTRVVTRFTDYL